MFNINYVLILIIIALVLVVVGSIINPIDKICIRNGYMDGFKQTDSDTKYYCQDKNNEWRQVLVKDLILDKRIIGEIN